MSDKISRLEQLAVKAQDAKVEESIEDTILDLVVYMAIFESGRTRNSMEQCTSVSRLIDFIESLESITVEPDTWFNDLQEELTEEVFSNEVKRYIVSFIKTMTLPTMNFKY